MLVVLVPVVGGKCKHDTCSVVPAAAVANWTSLRCSTQTRRA